MIKGDLDFGIESFNLKFINKNISTVGVIELPWQPLRPDKHFGSHIKVGITIREPEPLKFRTPAYITREKNSAGLWMGIKFVLEEKNREQLQKLIRRHGFYPKAFERKYPRIPVNPEMGALPLRAMGELSDIEGNDSAPYVLDLHNISLGGILVSTENPFAMTLSPGDNLRIWLEPRGDTRERICVDTRICWTSEELNSKNGNLLRLMGLSFVKMDDTSKPVFMALLKKVLTGMSQKGASS